MTAVKHDPLCPQSEVLDGCSCFEWLRKRMPDREFNPETDCERCDCQCDIIAKVRATYDTVDPKTQ